MSNGNTDQIRHWLAVADDQDTQEKKLAARYTAAAAARLWVLGKLDSESDVPEAWGQVREFSNEADSYLDDDRQDEAMYRRAQANVLALRLFEDSGEGQRPDGEDAHSDDDSDEDDGETDESDEGDKT